MADRVHFARTKDGWNIALHHHIAPISNPDLAPVIVVHGIATNKYIMDLDKRHSLPYFLKLRGFDVFVVSLRGCGRSYHESVNGYEDFTFDDIVKYDLPAIIEKVKSISGSPRVNYVGHSMGAMIMYAYCGIHGKSARQSIASFCSLAGPGNLNHVGMTLIGLLSRFPNARRMLDLKFGASMVAPLAGELYTPIDEILYNPKVTTKGTIKRIMKNAIENVADGVIEQFMSWIETKKMTSRNGHYDYIALETEIDMPALFLTGKRDSIAIPDSVEYVYNRAGSKHKEFQVIAKENGFSEDYGHACIVMGDRAEDDVFPLVENFLKKYGFREKDTIVREAVHSLKRFWQFLKIRFSD